ncbi:MAG: hypothetical protein CMA88_02575 [Euryarchaeota archaeon]|nr:hypothetical protein [Euryarchaeota archaeon]|tara:strand:- start:540 stop:1025 length:486 start_codon:yes stop_codon:yes gene_type:complete
MEEQGRTIPRPDSDPNEKLLFLRENMVHLTNQLSMPVIEVALVISKFIRIVIDSLKNAAASSGEELPTSFLEPIPLDAEITNDSARIGVESFPLENLINRVDEDRMDILDTLIRTVLNESQLEFVHALQEFREWESEIRGQLSRVSSPGGLFSPLDLREGF